MKKRVSRFLFPFLATPFLLLGLTACSLGPDDSTLWTRSDMPLSGMKQVVTYNLRGPAGSAQEVNEAKLRGVNEDAPTLGQRVIFDKLEGSKTQDVEVTLPDGRIYRALGMVKTQRFAGLSHFLTLESATYSGVDYKGDTFCGAKIRLDFNRNFVQYFDSDKRDWDSLWYYDIPCAQDSTGLHMNMRAAKLRSVVLNQVWQARIASGSFFFNWGHSVTIIGGPAAKLLGGWWTNWNVPYTNNDAMGAVTIANEMVHDLETSPEPWVEFRADGKYRDAYLIYSAGDADTYATWKRIFLNRQKEYVVLYRPNRTTSWDWITVKPVYNYEWNDVHQNITAIKHLSPFNPLKGKLDKSGMPKDPTDDVVKELERIGWMNAPNASLEQIQFIDRNGKILYAMTVRAFLGAKDSLIMFGKVKPDLKSIQKKVDALPEAGFPKPVLYDENGHKLKNDEQPYTDEQWATWQREATMWNFLKDNPFSVGADLLVQYRFADNSSWTANYCGDPSYICGYDPVEWNLSASYYFDNGNIRKAWLISQLLGEVGVRTLGMSYASGLYAGTGLLFAMAQIVHREEFFSGYGPESIWRFDARASQLPDTLAEAWNALHRN